MTRCGVPQQSSGDGQSSRPSSSAVSSRRSSLSTPTSFGRWAEEEELTSQDLQAYLSQTPFCTVSAATASGTHSLLRHELLHLTPRQDLQAVHDSAVMLDPVLQLTQLSSSALAVHCASLRCADFGGDDTRIAFAASQAPLLLQDAATPLIAELHALHPAGAAPPGLPPVCMCSLTDACTVTVF